MLDMLLPVPHSLNVDLAATDQPMLEGRPMAKTSLTGRLFLLICLPIFFAPVPAPAENVPHEIGGIALGSKVESYSDIVRSNFLKEVVVTDWHGFRNGVISYGTCRHDGEILKIDMKYEDRSKEFYTTLLEKFREKFGPPTSWHGDSFGVMLIWKWQFVDSEKNKISLTLQHNGKYSTETIGNMVKLSFPEKIEEERLCFIDMCVKHNEQTDEKRREELKKTDWSFLVPR
jgi:hypothetical protein